MADMNRILIVANVALAGLAVAPLFTHVDPNANVILMASLTVFVGCLQSVKPSAPAETMSKEHAMRFPLIGSAVLVSLFLLFKFLPKDLVNMALTGYFVFLGILALSATILPWIEDYLPESWNQDVIRWKVPYVQDMDVEFTWSQLVSAVPSTAFCAWYVAKKHWLANNILGLAFSIQGIEMLSLGSFKIGAILLVLALNALYHGRDHSVGMVIMDGEGYSKLGFQDPVDVTVGLFFYDIFWVFFTPVMVTVAKSFNAPIKLLFPTGDASKPYSLLGLGDIVIPGIFVALALRFDVSRKMGPRYFVSCFAGYVAGLVTTIVVMNVFKAAQPALLYIVPGVMGFTAVHALIQGEIKEILAYEETSETEGEDEGTKADGKESDKTDGVADAAAAAAAELKGSKAD